MSQVAVQGDDGRDALHCDLDGLVDLLERVEALQESQCGVLRLVDRGARHGSIYVERGRICWAVADGMQQRLTDMVLQEALLPVVRSDLERLYMRCRDEGEPLGQTLVACGIIDEAGLYSALGRHSAEALVRMSGWGALVEGFQEHAERTYDAMFTFEPVALLSWVGSERHPESALEHGRVLSAIVPGGCFGASYVWPEDYLDQLPVRVVSAEGRAASAAVGLGRWAHNALDLASAVVEHPSPVTAISSTGEAIVAFMGGNGFYAAVCDSFQGVARLLSNYTRIENPLKPK